MDRPRGAGPRGGRIATLETFFDYYLNAVFNPDEAVARNPAIRQQLRMHPDVAGDFAKRSFSVSAMPWRVERNPDCGDHGMGDKVAKYVQGVLEGLPSLTQFFEAMQEAVIAGGQGIELTWNQNADGTEVPQEWHEVHMSRFIFDRLGNMALLTRDRPIWGVYVSSDPQAQYSQRLPHGKFLYHIHRRGQGTWDNPDLEGYQYFGYGEDIALYFTITYDIFCLKYHMKFIERFGIPPTVLYYPENRALSKEMVRIADSCRGESIITVPKLIGVGVQDNKNSLYQIDQLPPPAGSINFFQDFHERYTRPRVSCILLGAAEESQKTPGSGGGYSEAVSKKDSGPNIWFKRDAINISETINKQFVPPTVLGRFPNLPKSYWPKFTLEPAEEKDRMQEAQILGEAMKSVPIVEEEYYERVGIRKPGPNDKTIGGPGSAQNQQPMMQSPTAGANGKHGPSAFPNMHERGAIGGGLSNRGVAGGH